MSGSTFMFDYPGMGERASMAVDIVEERAHQVLEYIAALNRQGHKPTVSDVEAYGTRPTRRVTQRSIYHDFSYFMADTGLGSLGSLTDETYVDYFKRLRWAKVVGGSVSVTPLALALLRELNSAKVDEGTQSYVEVVVDPEDKMSFTRLLHQFNNLGSGLLVDPYLRLEQFLEIADYTPVSRILTSSRAFGNELQRKVYQRALAAAEGRIEVRSIESLHDRHYIPEQGNIWMLGISLNGVAKNVSVLTQLGDESSTVLRVAYEKFWTEATPLEPAAAVLPGREEAS